jgi:galactokinase
MPAQPHIREIFQHIYGQWPSIGVRSPGRINLLGEHTDYNGGPVLPTAIDRAIWLAAAPRTDGRCRLWACDYGEGCVIEARPSARLGQPTWANYLLGVLAEMGWPGGMDIAFGGDLPIGAGVSSSAALENATALAANSLFGLGHTRADLVRIAHRAENAFVGVPCGIMDMFAGMMGRKGAFIHLDCQTLTWEYLPFEAPDLAFVLCHSGIERRLATSEYGARRRECAQGLAVLQTLEPGLKNLSEATSALLEAAKHDMSQVVFRRCRYVLEEVARVAAAVEALHQKDYAALGALLYQTHAGLRDDFEVSSPELDFLVEQAAQHPACSGARLMGAGFGGCTLNLVRQSEAYDFIAWVSEGYLSAFDRPLLAWIVRPADGTEIIFQAD